jgi:hypothetical protein
MRRHWWLIGLGAAVLVAILSPLASIHPDGLERVAEDHGFIDSAAEPAFSIIPDYVFPGVANDSLATILAGLLGTALLFLLMWGVAHLLARKRSTV